jgi:hypothetical protein
MEPTGCICSSLPCSLTGQKVASCDATALSQLWCQTAANRTNSCP